MADVIRHKRSATAAAVPSAGQLELGELAINVADGRLYFKKSSGEVVAVANMADIWAMQPIGKPFGLWTHLAGVAVPPTDNPNYRYIKLTASDSYNDGVLTSESISGSAPHVQATAVISDAGSPLNGQTVQLVNTGRWLLRPGQSGVVELDALQHHVHESQLGSNDSSGANPTKSPGFTAFKTNRAVTGIAGANLGTFALALTGSPVVDGAATLARTATATRDKSIGADYYMRIR